MSGILLTGASGFLGKIIKESNLSDVLTLGRSNDMNIICDLALEVPVLPPVTVVIHAAGKAHSVPRTEVEKKEFFDINVNGTTNLLSAISNSDSLPKSFVLISTVAVYGLDAGENIDENHPLDASDAYGLSKAMAENIVKKWCEENGVICLVLRLPLIAGPNPPGNLKSMIDGIRKGYYMNIAGGTAKKSIVLAKDVAEVINSAAMIGGTFNLSDGQNPSFAELANHIAEQLGKSKPRNVPAVIAKVIARVGDLIGNKSPFNSNKLNKMTSNLTFNDSKARKLLRWNPTSVLNGFRIN